LVTGVQTCALPISLCVDVNRANHSLKRTRTPTKALDKRACIYGDRVNSRVVGQQEVIQKRTGTRQDTPATIGQLASRSPTAAGPPGLPKSPATSVARQPSLTITSTVDTDDYPLRTPHRA